MIRNAFQNGPLAVIACLIFGSSLVNAAVVFSEDFESPDVPATTGGLLNNGPVPTDWVGANQGFGASRRGIVDKAGGDFSAAAGNDQAFAFRYTNSGLTSAEGVIGALTLGTTITISFDVVRDDGGDSGTPYIAQLIAMPGGAARNDTRPSFTNFTLLASVSGDSSGDGLFTTIMFDYTPEAGDPGIGDDLTVRFLGATTSATIDNVSVDVSPVPEPGSMALFGLGGLLFFARRRRG